MDLLAFDGGQLYFEEHTRADVMALIEQAAEQYGAPLAEDLLMRALFMAPENLTVLVALYRYYFYQYRYEDALTITAKVLRVIAARIGFPPKWQDINMNDLGWGIMQSFQLVRLYLYALKGAGYLNLRQGRIDEAAAMLTKVVELDSRDRIGAQMLLTVAEHQRLRERGVECLVSEGY
ncbi:hypothetical protein [Gynuella sp.]|uniref:hypothetical protein n=1 Tax=Gynuella sp. TaxID=2969146 RepID=UPI003D114272